MKLAILGTRGVPNAYGGFEQFAEYISRYLSDKGHQVYVYCSSSHPNKEENWHGVHRIEKTDPEHRIGTIGQFIYDLNCILDARGRSFDIILQLGYTSNSIWGWLLPRNSVIITNMDGLEWKRTKYSKGVQYFLKFAEALGVRYSDYLISDSLGIQKHLVERHKAHSHFIPYGATVFDTPSWEIINNKYNHVIKYEYDMLIARMEPENNIEMILRSKTLTKRNRILIIIGSTGNDYGTYLKKQYSNDSRIQFLGPIYDLEILNNLRYHSNLYFHGHSVGGTNPSLLEAMSSSSLICAHDNIFNRSVLDSDAFYFSNSEDLVCLMDSIRKKDYISYVEKNIEKIRNKYSWRSINEQYESLMIEALSLQAK